MPYLKQLALIIFPLFVAAVALQLVARSSEAVHNGLAPAKGYLSMLKPEVSAEELKNKLKVFLSKIKLRRVPLTKRRTERQLSKLYKEERELKDTIAELERNLKRVSNNMSRHQRIQILEVEKPHAAKTKPDGSGLLKAPAVAPKVTELTTGKINEWKSELSVAQAALAKLQLKIAEAKDIIKNPENYISVPSNYGIDPVGVRQREREILIKDRENMLFREQIRHGEVQPLWLVDSW